MGVFPEGGDRAIVLLEESDAMSHEPRTEYISKYSIALDSESSGRLKRPKVNDRGRFLESIPRKLLLLRVVDPIGR